MPIVWMAASAYAQPTATISIRTNVTNVAVGQPFDVSIEAEADGARIGELQLPNLNAFDILGHSQSTPFQFSVSFGSKAHVQSSQIHQFRLSARSEGQFSIGPAQVTVAGQVYTSNTVDIKVVAGNAPGGQGVQPTPPRFDANGAELDPSGFVRVLINNKKPYIGQAIRIDVLLYASSRIPTQTIVANKIQGDGFWFTIWTTNDKNVSRMLMEPTTQSIHSIRFWRFPRKQASSS
ncbi:MAG: BatD family protein [Polyangiales bacterium]